MGFMQACRKRTIIGNAQEWTQDWYHEDYYKKSPERNPPGPSWGIEKVIRGGHHGALREACAADWRFSWPPGRPKGGIRLLREITPESRPPDPPKRSPGPRCVVESRKIVEVPLDANEVLRLVRIEPGRFTMGSPDTETLRGKLEGPQTEVVLGQAFLLGIYEVTQAQFEAVVGRNPSAFPGADRPVEHVSWPEAVAFCEALTERERTAGRLAEGKSYRLPTEAEWEYACRAGSTSRYCFGGEIERVVDFGWVDVLGGTRPVGQLYPNSWGLFDMHGNVWEWTWTSDRGWKYPGGTLENSKDEGPKHGFRVARGGGWNFAPHTARAAARYVLHYHIEYNFVGFRVARDL